jgi:hypothetical protein
LELFAHFLAQRLQDFENFDGLGSRSMRYLEQIAASGSPP